MPNDNKNSSNTPQGNQPPTDMPVFMEENLPPMVGDESPPQSDLQNPSPASSVVSDSPVGSSAPTDDIQVTGPVIAAASSTPKKKFGGGKVIATILGLFLLVGGLGAGIILVRQNQDIAEKAVSPGACVCADNETGKNTGCTCHGSNGQCNSSSSHMKQDKCGESGGGGGGSPTGCSAKTSSGSCESSCSPEKSNGKKFECKWINGHCTESANECGSSGNNKHTTKVACGTTGSVQCGKTPDGCGGFCILPVDDTCDDMLRKECNFEPQRGANYKANASYFNKNDCPSGYQSAFCDCTNPSDSKRYGVCFDRGLDTQCHTSDGLCAVFNNSQTTGGPNGEKCGVKKTYYCDSKVDLSGGKSCDTSTGGTTTKPANFCGTIQEDISCQGFKTTVIPCSTEKPTSNSPTAQCQNVKAYDTNWTQLTATQLKGLKAGDKVRFTVAGQASSGNFTKARFTINGTVRGEVTGKKPNTQEFFDEYTIPAGVTTFNITAQIYHETLGWK